MKSNETIESMLKKQTQLKTYYGVYTSSSSRDDMMSILARHVNEYKEKFVSHNVIRDLSRLVRTSSGKVAAGPGFHDDSIMSYLIALYVYYHGNNLEVFGIRRGMMENEPENRGMKHPEEINHDLVPQELIQGVMKQEEKVKMTERTNWDNLMREAILKSQQESYLLHQNGMEHTVFDNSSNVIVEGDTSDGSIPLDFFTSINNM